jgi:hypothetical protein
MGLVGCVVACLACATSTPDDGDNGAGATGAQGGADGGAAGEAGQGAGGQGGVATGGGGQGGAAGEGGDGGEGGQPDNCGDGLVQHPETCDGTNFDDKTCEDFGLNPGTLQCNSNCQVVVSACAPPETCTNGSDDDGDGFVDCLDSECSALAVCLDSCASPKLVVLPAFDFRSNAGRPDTYAASCGAATDSEYMYSFVANFTGMLGVRVSQNTADLQVAVSGVCGGSDVACTSRVSNKLFYENMQVPVTTGTTYFLMVDGAAPGEVGNFDIQLEQVSGPEFFCDDLWDDDADGLLDCDDSDCQANAVCSLGSNSLGNACFDHGDCAAVNDDALCLPDFYGFSGGYCSEFCDLVSDDCPGDGLCFDYGIGDHGVCLDGCTTSAECRPGYECRNLGLATDVCYIPPESNCNDYDDNDADQLTDCEDPDCQATAACTIGAVPYGSGCTAHNQCAVNAGADPLCLDNAFFGFPGGYCSEFCDSTGSGCSADGVCSPWFFFPSGAGQCFKKCVTVADCAPGLSCVNYGFGNHCNF